MALMTVMNEVVRCGGNNHYNLQHIGKERLDRIGGLPPTMEFDDDEDHKGDDGSVGEYEYGEETVEEIDEVNEESDVEEEEQEE